MKITGKNFQLDTRLPEKQITFGDLEPGDVFKYLRGKDENIYVKGAASIFLLTNNGEFSNDTGRRDTPLTTPVIFYPDAELTLGEPRNVQA